MSHAIRRALGVVVAAVATVGTGAASRAPWTATPAGEALLRLSWRAQSETTEECRPLTDQEKAELPVHMQVPEICESRAVPYLLRVTIDGSVLLADTVHGAGAREDRPVYVFREIELVPGLHSLDVEFSPIGHGTARDDDNAQETDHEEDEEIEDDEDDAAGEDEERMISLRYSETIRIGDREVVLVAHDRARGALVRVAGP